MSKGFSKKEKKPLSEDECNEIAQSLAKEINTLRRDPGLYIDILEKDISYFGELNTPNENTLYRPDEEPLKTKEGRKAHDEAIEFLRRQKPVEELVYDDRLALAAKDHIDDIGSKGLISHEGSNKESVSDRVEKYCEWDYFMCQNIDFGARNVREIMIAFLTGDGDTQRSHRNNFFREESKFIGVYCGSHSETDTATSVLYAGNVRELGSIPPEVRDFVDIMRKKEEDSKNKPKKRLNKFQIEDPDAPDNAVSYSTYKKIKLVDGRAKHCTQKVYTLDDGTPHIVETLEDLIPVRFKK